MLVNVLRHQGFTIIPAAIEVTGGAGLQFGEEESVKLTHTPPCLVLRGSEIVLVFLHLVEWRFLCCICSCCSNSNSSKVMACN